ncbi:hypothetical protein [Spongiactinospora gelatinilytica]|uniref:hypothetical protein n=1 Tax=Spongiactinospora gelatinilytica TaxID=2666298 RepID=UPI0013145176|nr:hypothetical protein [Spongiactinospora gelatinilytica]
MLEFTHEGKDNLVNEIGANRGKPLLFAETRLVTVKAESKVQVGTANPAHLQKTP